MSSASIPPASCDAPQTGVILDIDVYGSMNVSEQDKFIGRCNEIVEEIVGVMKLVPQERVNELTFERRSSVSTNHRGHRRSHERELPRTCFGDDWGTGGCSCTSSCRAAHHRERTSDRVTEQIVHVVVPEIREPDVELAQAIPQERLQQCTVDQIEVIQDILKKEKKRVFLIVSLSKWCESCVSVSQFLFVQRA